MSDEIDYEALAGNLACGNDLPTAIAGSIKDESPPKAGFGTFLIWLFLAALAMMFFVARFSN